MNNVILAKAYLFVDDPYGDGIRLEHVRNPSPARIAAKDLVYTGQATFDAEAMMIAERGDEIKQALRTKSARACMVRNSSLTEAEVEELRSTI